MEDRIKALEEKFADFETRLNALEAFTGIGDFDAEGLASIHRRVDQLEDRVYDRGDY